MSAKCIIGIIVAAAFGIYGLVCVARRKFYVAWRVKKPEGETSGEFYYRGWKAVVMGIALIAVAVLFALIICGVIENPF